MRRGRRGAQPADVLTPRCARSGLRWCAGVTTRCTGSDWSTLLETFADLFGVLSAREFVTEQRAWSTPAEYIKRSKRPTQAENVKDSLLAIRICGPRYWALIVPAAPSPAHRSLWRRWRALLDGRSRRMLGMGWTPLSRQL